MLVMSRSNTSQNLCLSALSLDFLNRRFAKLVGLDCQSLFELPFTQNLDRCSGSGHQSNCFERVQRHGFFSIKAVKASEIDDRILFPEGVFETPLRNAAGQRHLPSLKPGAFASAGSCKLSLVAF